MVKVKGREPKEHMRGVKRAAEGTLSITERTRERGRDDEKKERGSDREKGSAKSHQPEIK